MPNFLALIDKWNPHIYGHGNNENIINYFKHKYYLIWKLHNPSDLWYCHSNFPQDLVFPEIWNAAQPITLHFAICNKIYYYKGRQWVIKNKAFYDFISKVKSYYKNKLAFYKKTKTILLKQIHGKYIYK